MVGYISGGNTFPKPLTQEEESRLLTEYAAGKDEAKDILIERNLRLVAHVVKKYSQHGKENEDMISIGTIGLIKAISTYKPEKGTRLATYAARCIENAILFCVAHLAPLKDLHHITIDYYVLQNLPQQL